MPTCPLQNNLNKCFCSRGNFLTLNGTILEILNTDILPVADDDMDDSAADSLVDNESNELCCSSKTFC